MSERKAQRRSAKREQAPPRGDLHHAETFVEELDPSLTAALDYGDFYVDETLAAPESANVGTEKLPTGGNRRPAEANHPLEVNARLSTEVEGQSRKRRVAKRAAERRRDRGESPAGVEGTHTALQQRRERGANAQPAAAHGVLQCIKGPETGVALNLLDGTYTIGRGRENSFVLKDIATSRQHIRIEVRASQVVVEDMGSGNGTRVNGKRIERVRLQPGDRVELGNSVLQFQLLGDASAEGPPGIGPKAQVADDVQRRIVEAAERLAAELSERLAVEDDGAAAGARKAEREQGANPAFSESAIEDVLTASAQRAQQRAAARNPMPDALWNETQTNVPLSEVVAADSPLGRLDKKGRATEEGASVPDLFASELPAARVVDAPQSAGPPHAQRKGDPHRAAPSSHVAVGEPHPPAAPPSSPRRWGRYLAVVGVVALLLVAAGAGVGLALRTMARNDEQFVEVTAKASTALAAGDLDAALRFAEHASELRPGDAATQALLVAIRAARAAKAPPSGGALPSPGGEEAAQDANASPAGTRGAAVDVPKGAEAPTAPEAAPPSPPDLAPRVSPSPSNAPRVATRGATVDVPKGAEAPTAPEAAPPSPPDPAPRVSPSPSNAPRVATPPPRTSSARRRRARAPQGMSEGEAKSVYIAAMKAVRGDDEVRGCALIHKVAKEAPRDSNWRVKAKNAITRYGCD